MSSYTGNSEALRRQVVYSQTILDEMRDNNFLPEGLARDVSDFGDGDTLKITTFGEAVLVDLDPENTPIPTNSVDTGRIDLVINKFVGGGFYMTDQNKEDSHQAAQLDAAIPSKMMAALKENYETDLLATANRQTIATPNAVNGFAHRYIASGTSGVITMDDFIYAKLAFDKIGMPESGRIVVVDPLVEATLNTIIPLSAISNNPMFEGLVNTGFGQNMRFSKNIFGFDVYVTNRLPTVASETIDTTSISVAAPSGNGVLATAGVVNQFMCISDDMTTPYMSAWRRKPKVEYYREASAERDVYQLSARWGMGIQRPQSLISLVTAADKY